MLDLNTIYNENCLDTIAKIDNNSLDLVVTSPPYNVQRRSSAKGGWIYDEFKDDMPNDEYRKLCLNVFKGLYKKVKQDGVIVWNVSYNRNNPDVWLFVVSDIITKTKWCFHDLIVWKKTCALPNNTDPNTLSRITETIFIFSKGKEVHMNRELSSLRKNGQKMYVPIMNYITAKNNDGHTDFNQATFSTELVTKLLNIYGRKDGVCYDPFIGTGTTAVGCVKMGMNYIGSEISKTQCEYAEKRLNVHKEEKRRNPFMFDDWN